MQLANEVGVDPWFNMPHLADAEYIRNFATYVRDNLDPALTAKVEYSNEAWNWSFQQTQWLLQQAKSEWGVDGGSGYIDYHAKMATQAAVIWQEVYEGEPEGRLSNVIGTQSVNSWMTKRLLEAPGWKVNEPDAYVDPATVFEDIAVTTYFGGTDVSNSERREALIEAIKDPDVDASAYLYERLLDPGLNDSIQGKGKVMEAQAKVAEAFGMNLVAYEGGQHVHHSFAVRGMSETDLSLLTDFMTEFLRSPEMADLYRKSWESWAEIGDGAYMQFGDMTLPSKWGAWGIYESLDTVTLRGQALNDLNATETPWWDAVGGEHYQQGVTLTGTMSADLLTGTSQEDYLLGGQGDDTLMGGRGNDGLNGGDGIDRAVFEGVASDYRIEVEGKGHRLTGPDGRDFLINVEELEFAGGEVLTLQQMMDGQSGVVDDASASPPADGPLDPAGVGVTVSAINMWSAVGKALDSSRETPSYAVIANGATAEIDGVEVKASYWSLNDGRASRDGPMLGTGPLDAINALGTVLRAPETIVIGAGNDTFHGREEDSTVYAGAGDDRLFGGGGADVLDGGAGRDLLIGGTGDDVLTGGAGRDRFIFGAGDGNDRITDFDTASDSLELRGFLGAGQTIADAVSYGTEGMILSNGTDSILLEGIGSETSVSLDAANGAVVFGQTPQSRDVAIELAAPEEAVDITISALNRWSGRPRGLRRPRDGRERRDRWPDDPCELLEPERGAGLEGRAAVVGRSADAGARLRPNRGRHRDPGHRGRRRSLLRAQ